MTPFAEQWRARATNVACLGAALASCGCQTSPAPPDAHVEADAPRVDARAAPDALAIDAYAADAHADDVYAADAHADDAHADDAHADDAYADDAYVDDAFSLDAFTPDAFVPTPLDDVRRARFAPDEVYLAGTLQEGACYRDAFARPDSPDVVGVGADCYFNEQSAMLTPDGTLLYFNTFEYELRELHCDGCPDFEPGDPYPSGVLANDTIRPTPPCDPASTANRLRGFRVAPSGAVLHTCGDVWYDEAGSERARDVAITSLGWRDLAFVDTPPRLLDLATGTLTDVPALTCLVYTVRAGATEGFDAVIGCTPDERELWHVAEDGVAVRRGIYPPLPSGYSHRGTATLAGDGSLWYLASGPGRFEDTIVRRTIEGATEVVYTEARVPTPAILVHGSDLVTGP